MDLRECYAVLELPHDAGPQEVERSYRILVQVWHPDRFGHNTELRDEANAKLTKINVAHATLVAAFQSEAQVGETPQTLYRDTCVYKGSDPRLAPLASFSLRSGREAVVEVRQEGVVLAFEAPEAEVVFYPTHTIRAVWESGRKWVTADTLVHARTFPNEFDRRELILSFSDPEGILSTAINVTLRFKNDYYAAVFMKRLQAAYGLVDANTRVPSPTPAEQRKQQQQDAASVTVFLIIVSILIVVAVVAVLASQAGQ